MVRHQKLCARVHHLVTHLLLFHLLISFALAGDGRRRVLHLPGDLLLGGLFPMHEQVRFPVELREGVKKKGTGSVTVKYPFFLRLP